MKSINLSEFKAECFAKVKLVSDNGEPLCLMLRNKPLAIVYPYNPELEDSGKRILGQQKGDIKGDIVNFDLSDDWDMFVEKQVGKKKSRARSK